MYYVPVYISVIILLYIILAYADVSECTYIKPAHVDVICTSVYICPNSVVYYTCVR